jgi:hypothetical protein
VRFWMLSCPSSITPSSWFFVMKRVRAQIMAPKARELSTSGAGVQSGKAGAYAAMGDVD